MQDDLKNILSNAGGTTSQDQLLKYLKDELTQVEKHDLESKAVDDAFESDALDGLQELQNREKLELIVDGLNRDLKKRVSKKSELRGKMQLKTHWTLYFSILIFLIIIVLVYLYLHRRMYP
ncbi:hypothetical protein U0035_09415 [Niabella yanshanensis]|uniref:Uncharacterized protein n=1 Tax=Niabella yanshanensis TaxID=577386 RepID=A0ABZ0WCE9_9BACT|nr:hypothetical protein [Niabella yanshanensis]WQD40362.1 hypothetical protein U0035_09415 [Niabella yanshanensis]